ncbi:hypothetical protein F5Y18DRAFT_402589 [Xylariaceae sp. FL1019]|nr:hypothetical protein F5Y18DRAFT_402589 [Xylariaceae sp. FL1019]
MMDTETEASRGATESPTEDSPHCYGHGYEAADEMEICTESSETTSSPLSGPAEGQTPPQAAWPQVPFDLAKDAASVISQSDSFEADLLWWRSRYPSQELQSDTDPTSVSTHTKHDSDVDLNVQAKVDIRTDDKFDGRIGTTVDNAIDLTGIGSQYDDDEGFWKNDINSFWPRDRHGAQLPLPPQTELPRATQRFQLQAKPDTPRLHKIVKRSPKRKAQKQQLPMRVTASHSISHKPMGQTETPMSNLWRTLKAQSNRIKAGLPLDFGPPTAGTHARRSYDEERQKKRDGIVALERKQARLYTLPVRDLSLQETTYWNVFSPESDLRSFPKSRGDLEVIRSTPAHPTPPVLPSIKDSGIKHLLHRQEAAFTTPFPLADILKRKTAQGITGRPPNKEANRAKRAQAPPKPTHPAPLLDPAQYGPIPVDEAFSFLMMDLEDMLDCSILHLGCREGAVTLAIYDIVSSAGGKVAGIDTRSSYIDAAGDACQRCNFKGARENVRFQHVPEMTQLPFASNSFDLVFAEDIMSRLPNAVVNDEAQEDYVLQILKEMIRVTKSGGHTACREPIAQHFIPSYDLDNLYTMNMFKAAGMRKGFMGNRIAPLMRRAGLDLRNAPIVSTSATGWGPLVSSGRMGHTIISQMSPHGSARQLWTKAGIPPSICDLICVQMQQWNSNPSSIFTTMYLEIMAEKDIPQSSPEAEVPEGPSYWVYESRQHAVM